MSAGRVEQLERGLSSYAAGWQAPPKAARSDRLTGTVDMSLEIDATRSKLRGHVGKNFPLLAVVVALAIGSILAQAQSVTATVASGTSPDAVAVNR